MTKIESLLLIIGLLGGLVIVALVVAYFTAQEHERRIRAYLGQRGASDITITRLWFPGERDDSVYGVTYRDGDGIRHRKRCKISRRLAYDKNIYWTDAP